MVDGCASVSIQMILLEVENRGRGKRIPRQVGVDVGGGVETNGVKDLGKIKSFVTNAKQA